MDKLGKILPPPPPLAAIIFVLWPVELFVTLVMVTFAPAIKMSCCQLVNPLASPIIGERRTKLVAVTLEKVAFETTVKLFMVVFPVRVAFVMLAPDTRLEDTPAVKAVVALVAEVALPMKVPVILFPEFVNVTAPALLLVIPLVELLTMRF